MFKSIYDGVSKLMGNYQIEAKVLVVGLDFVGKTALYHKLITGETVLSTKPTMGENVSGITYKNLKMVIWDVGGQNKLRSLWSYYYMYTNIIIFIIDSTDREPYRINEIKDELKKLCVHDQLKDSILLIYANKQDLTTCNPMNCNELTNLLELNTTITNKEWTILPCSVVNGDNIYEGLDWAYNTLYNKEKLV